MEYLHRLITAEHKNNSRASHTAWKKQVGGKLCEDGKVPLPLAGDIPLCR